MNEHIKLEAVTSYAEECAAAIRDALRDHGGESEGDLICYFLEEAEDQERWGLENECVRRAQPMLEASPLSDGLCLVGGTIGIETSERCFPTLPLISERSLLLFEIAERSGMKFTYWSFEPLGRGNWSGANLDDVYAAQVSSLDLKSLLPRAISMVANNAQTH